MFEHHPPHKLETSLMDAGCDESAIQAKDTSYNKQHKNVISIIARE